MWDEPTNIQYTYGPSDLIAYSYFLGPSHAAYQQPVSVLPEPKHRVCLPHNHLLSMPIKDLKLHESHKRRIVFSRSCAQYQMIAQREFAIKANQSREGLVGKKVSMYNLESVPAASMKTEISSPSGGPGPTAYQSAAVK